MKIISIVGARPQFIKYAPLSKQLEKEHELILIHTGQHYDYNMNRVFFEELGISDPKYNLGIGSGTHAYQTGEMMKGIENILIKEKPSLVILFGDTNSTLAGALATIKIHIRTSHVEAGLRSFDKSIPEEINRIVADYCSEYLFCPTQTAVNNLKQEGMTRGVYLTGDVMVDALHFNRELAERSDILNNLGLINKQYILVTIHRAGLTENQQIMKNVVNALNILCDEGVNIVFPIHPRTEKLLKSYNLYNSLNTKLKLIEPQGYFEFLKLMIHANKIMTDSGGIQKEAYILKTPCITLMNNTPWVETLNDGWNVLAGTDPAKIIDLAHKFNPNYHQSNYFGTGACVNISEIIRSI